MGAARVEPFQRAVIALREGLQAGQFAPGERIAVSELAESLRLSATPVREALSRLSGEGLLEDRRGQGFFVRVLMAVDIADLFRLSLAQLTIAHDPRRRRLRPTPGPDAAGPQAGTDPVRDTERRFETWISHRGSRALLVAYRSVQVQLGPVRRLEPHVFDDLAREAEGLRACRPEETGVLDLALVRRFHLRRIAFAGRLAELLQSST